MKAKSHQSRLRVRDVAELAFMVPVCIALCVLAFIVRGRPEESRYAD